MGSAYPEVRLQVLQHAGVAEGIRFHPCKVEKFCDAFVVRAQQLCVDIGGNELRIFANLGEAVTAEELRFEGQAEELLQAEPACTFLERQQHRASHAAAEVFLGDTQSAYFAQVLPHHVQRTVANHTPFGVLGNYESGNRAVELDHVLAEKDSPGDERFHQIHDLRNVVRGRGAYVDGAGIAHTHVQSLVLTQRLTVMADSRVRRQGLSGQNDAVPSTSLPLPLSFDACYRAASGRDERWDGRFYLGVTSTGIYCRPSCPARKPKPENCRFFPTAAACVAAGFRACKRCRPDALPGSRDWDHRGDLVARAVRRIRDGAVDELGVAGLARDLAVSERHLRRILLDEIGATPLQLARTRRAHAARTLIEQTTLPLTDVAFASGFGSIRQFGETMREEFGVAPSALGRREGASDPATDGGPVAADLPRIALRLQTRAPFDGVATRAFLSAHAIPGRDEIDAVAFTTAHALDVPGGTASVKIAWAEVPAVSEQLSPTLGVPVVLILPSLADTMPAIQVVRRMLDLDADPHQIAAALSPHPLLAPLVAARPGLRLPGARDPHEFALATVLGQQVTLAGARTLQGRLVAAFADAPPDSGANQRFAGRISAARIAAETPESLRATLRITGARAATLTLLAAALAEGLDLSPGADRERARAELLDLRGIGPWTVELIAMRALGDPDAYPSGDLILRRSLGVDSPREADQIAEPWRPYRGYATQFLWADFLADAGTKESA